MSDASRPLSPGVWRWRLAVWIATGIPLVIGFELSALANRLVFVAWALVSAGVLLVLLRRGWGLERRHQAPRLLGAATPLLLLLAALLWRHAELVELGARAWIPAARPLLRPAPVIALAATTGLAALLLSYVAGRRAS